MACARQTEQSIQLAPPDAARRRLLGQFLGLSGLAFDFAGCAAPVVALGAVFLTPSGGRVLFEFWGDEDFRFVPVNGGVESWVVDGTIYLVIAPSLAFANRGKLYRVGAAARVPRALAATPPSLQASSHSTDTVARWALPQPVFDVHVAASDATALPQKVTVAAVPSLAHAQFVADRSMRAAMDMSLCGDAVNQLLAAWPTQLTGTGFAALASSIGVTLAGPMRPLAAALQLPPDYDFEDLSRFQIRGS